MIWMENNRPMCPIMNEVTRWGKGKPHLGGDTLESKYTSFSIIRLQPFSEHSDICSPGLRPPIRLTCPSPTSDLPSFQRSSLIRNVYSQAIGVLMEFLFSDALPALLPEF